MANGDTLKEKGWQQAAQSVTFSGSAGSECSQNYSITKTRWYVVKYLLPH